MFNRITPFLASHRRRSSRLILGADDFGRSSDVNRAVERAWGAGMLTSASLMVTGDAFEEAADLARRTPGLAVGLHLVLADGRAALPSDEIPHLVDARGRFPRDPLRAGLRYALLGRRGRDELQRELAAQFERFASTGLPLAHVDGHCHLHAHPAVFGRVAAGEKVRRPRNPSAARLLLGSLIAMNRGGRVAAGGFGSRVVLAMSRLRPPPAPRGDGDRLPLLWPI